VHFCKYKERILKEKLIQMGCADSDGCYNCRGLVRLSKDNPRIKESKKSQGAE